MPDELASPQVGKRTPHQGNSVAYIIDRLERAGRHDLVEAIRAGRVKAYAVACELGWSKRPPAIGNGGYGNQARKRQHQLRSLLDGVNLNQLQELWIGPSHNGSLFADRLELQTAWEKNRDTVMRLWGSHGRRPLAWYEFEADFDRPSYDRERSTLWRLGVLTPEERIELELQWRAEFETAQEKDARARREHYVWHDIPHELVAEWTTERVASKKKVE
jgi:hypothetical protein